jgi:hypothetical protein
VACYKRDLHVWDSSMRYRYEEYLWERGVRLVLRQFKEIKKTPCGAWVNDSLYTKKRFVLDGSGKRYCHETKELAFHSYKRRKMLQAQHAQKSLEMSRFMMEETNKLDVAPEATIELGKPSFFDQYTFD